MLNMPSSIKELALGERIYLYCICLGLLCLDVNELGVCVSVGLSACPIRLSMSSSIQ